MSNIFGQFDPFGELDPFNPIFGMGLKDTKESVTKLYIEGKITKNQFIERMKKIKDKANGQQ